MPKKTTDKYEEKISRLEKIINKLQEDDLELSSSLSLYEEGIKLYRECREHLEDTKEKIRILEEKSDDL